MKISAAYSFVKNKLEHAPEQTSLEISSTLTETVYNPRVGY